MQLGIQPRTPFVDRYQGYEIVRSHGRMYGIPLWLQGENFGGRHGYSAHPAVLTAGTRAELEAQIDACAAETTQEPFSYVFAETEEGQTHDGTPIEFAGWLPIYSFSGNCGTHPQFKHTATPPQGYRFTCSQPKKPQPTRQRKGWFARCRDWFRGQMHRAKLLVRPLYGLVRPTPGVTLATRTRVTCAMIRLFFRLRRGGASLGACLRFLQSRHHQSQLLAGRSPHPQFLTSMPYTYNTQPWIIEIEDPTTLFYPLIQNGNTCDLRIEESPYFPVVKTLLESDECRGIVTHMRSTARMVPALFKSDLIARKVHYTPLGVRVPEKWQRHEEDTDELHLVFINSWCQVPENFYVRGGLDVLEAFDQLRQKYPRLRLTLRTDLPALDVHYHRIIERNWVRVIDRFQSAQEMETLLSGSHIFLLPAARIHVVSLLQAMSYGLAVVASDGWGIEEYLKDGDNGLVVKGRYGKVAWEDAQAGILRENYEPMQTSDPAVVAGIVTAVSRLVEDRTLRQRLAQKARHDVETNYSQDHWNRGLKEAFDRAFAPRGG